LKKIRVLFETLPKFFFYLRLFLSVVVTLACVLYTINRLFFGG
jgi:hypothetical protein